MTVCTMAPLYLPFIPGAHVREVYQCWGRSTNDCCIDPVLLGQSQAALVPVCSSAGVRFDQQTRGVQLLKKSPPCCVHSDSISQGSLHRGRPDSLGQPRRIGCHDLCWPMRGNAQPAQLTKRLVRKGIQTPTTGRFVALVRTSGGRSCGDNRFNGILVLASCNYCPGLGQAAGLALVSSSIPLFGETVHYTF